MSYPVPHIPIDPTPSQTAQRQAAAVEALGKELSSVRAELEVSRKELADFKAEYAVQCERNTLQQETDKKKMFAQQLLIACIPAAFAFLLDHINDIIKLF